MGVQSASTQKIEAFVSDAAALLRSYPFLQTPLGRSTRFRFVFLSTSMVDNHHRQSDKTYRMHHGQDGSISNGLQHGRAPTPQQQPLGDCPRSMCASPCYSSPLPPSHAPAEWVACQMHTCKESSGAQSNSFLMIMNNTFVYFCQISAHDTPPMPYYISIS